ncbi:MAG: hypothetical protein IJG13_00560, partial [Kiritimatiellae bacterium]|nr:hypothetical protein [Kiritimatiellia bacterium]
GADLPCSTLCIQRRGVDIQISPKGMSVIVSEAKCTFSWSSELVNLWMLLLDVQVRILTLGRARVERRSGSPIYWDGIIR